MKNIFAGHENISDEWKTYPWDMKTYPWDMKTYPMSGKHICGT